MLIPRFATPDGRAEATYLRRLAPRGLRARYGDPPPAEAVERLEMELDVIEQMGFESYFLIVWDFVKYAKDNGIAVGPGRGSAAGSIVSYALQHHRRRPARVRPAVRALPERRARVDAGHRHRLLGQGPRPRDPLRRREVRARRRSRRSSPSAGCSRAPPRATPRGCSGYDYGAGDRLAKLIPEPDHGPRRRLRGLPEAGRGARGRLRHRPAGAQIVDVARGPRGHRAQHLDPRRGGRDRRPPADRDRAAPARRGPRARRTTDGRARLQDGHAVLDEADRGDRPAEDGLPGPAQPRRDRVRARHHRALRPASGRTWRRCRSTTAKTYEMLARGDSIGVFQFESEGMREALRKVAPDRVRGPRRADRALPARAPMRFIDTYARNKRNPERVTYIDDAAAADHRVAPTA